MTTKTLDQHIEIIPGFASGKPHIAGHRIKVQNIVVLHEFMGRTADEIATEYDLDLADIYAAMTYYFDHKSEIDEDIQESEQFVENLRKQIPSKLVQTLYDR